MDFIDKILCEAFVTKNVISSNVESVGYDSKLRKLRLSFLNGRTYEYTDVPRSVFTRMLKVKSKGKFAHRNIIWTYDYELLGDEEEDE